MTSRETLIHRLGYRSSRIIHQFFWFSYINEASQYDIRTCKQAVRSSLKRKHNNDNTVLCQMLSVPKHQMFPTSPTPSPSTRIAPVCTLSTTSALSSHSSSTSPDWMINTFFSFGIPSDFATSAFAFKWRYSPWPEWHISASQENRSISVLPDRHVPIHGHPGK